MNIYRLEEEIIKRFKEVEKDKSFYHELKNSTKEEASKYRYYERTFYNTEFYNYDIKEDFYKRCFQFILNIGGLKQ